MNGTYGIKKPAIIESSDCDIFYTYRPSRNTDSGGFTAFKKLESSILAASNFTDGTAVSSLPGMYDLRLPLDKFNAAGIYVVYIKPKEIIGYITDVSTLSAYPNIRGVIINVSDFDGSVPEETDELVGYRIDYFDSETERSDVYRIITSSNRCEPVAQNMNNATQKGIMYRFNESSNLLFCTVTPNTAMSFKSSSMPYIGRSGQKIALVNTKFNPVALEIEITTNDFDTIATMLEGNQIRNLDAGLITTFNENGEIYHQAMYGNITNPSEGIHHDFKFNNSGVINFDEATNYEKIQNAI